MEGALRAVGQMLASVGSSDPRLTNAGKHEFRLQCQLTGYARADPPPNQVKPIPVQVIYHLAMLAQNHGSSDSMAVADLIILTFFFLMRPGEYTTAPTGDNTPSSWPMSNSTLEIAASRQLSPPRMTCHKPLS
jgi:hypothetical protein